MIKNFSIFALLMGITAFFYIVFWDNNFTLSITYDGNNDKKYKDTFLYIAPKYDFLRDSVSGNENHHALLSMEVKEIPIKFLNNPLGGAILVNNIQVQSFKFEQDEGPENIRYYFENFMGKDIHHENTWSSCSEKSCDINIQFYNNNFDLSGQYESISIELYSSDETISVSNNNPLLPSSESAQQKEYPLIKTHINNNLLVLDFIPIQTKDSTIIFQFNDDNGRSDIEFDDLSKIEIIDADSNTYRLSVEFEGDLKYAAALLYDGVNKVENKHVIVNEKEY